MLHNQSGEEPFYPGGSYFVLVVTERPGVKESGGMTRVGPVHYNTVEEIHRLGMALGKLLGSKTK